MHCIWESVEVNRINVVSGTQEVESGALRPSGLPGLGIEPDMAVLEQTVTTCH
jgi:hypothetical protein